MRNTADVTGQKLTSGFQNRSNQKKKILHKSLLTKNFNHCVPLVMIYGGET
jgi:hypothetical protein